jgi:hypothetical protein
MSKRICVARAVLLALAFFHNTALAADVRSSINTNIVGPTGLQATVSPTLGLQVSTQAKQIFLDTFDTGVNTTIYWNTPVSAGGGVAANLVTPGATTLGTGTTANGYSYLRTQTTFRASSPGYIEVYHAINLEFPITANTYRFWGLGNPAATPTAAAPITDGVGFEIATTGKMYAVSYSGGVRNVIQDLSTATGNSKQPSDAAVHKYFIYFRGDLAYWCIDSETTLVATMATGAPGPIVNNLPVLLLAAAGSIAPSSSGVLSNNGVFVGDTSGARGSTTADGTYPWIQATVKAASTPAVASDTSQVVSISPNNGVKVTDGTYNASIFPGGFLRTSDEPHSLLVDPFDGTLDTTERWSTVGSAGTPATTTNGVALIGAGTVASKYTTLQSIPNFAPVIPGWLGISSAIQIENPVLINAYRFWGAGFRTNAPTTASPISNGYGFEIDTAGKMYCVVYANSVRTVIQDLSAATGNAKQPTDANYHRYVIYYRTDKILFYIDGIDVGSLVGNSNFQSPVIQTLSAFFISINGSTPPTSTANITLTGTSVWDTTKSSSSIMDGVYGWRKSQIGPVDKGLVVTSPYAEVVGYQPNWNLLTGTLSQSNSFAGTAGGYTTSTSTVLLPVRPSNFFGYGQVTNTIYFKSANAADSSANVGAQKISVVVMGTDGVRYFADGIPTNGTTLVSFQLAAMVASGANIQFLERAEATTFGANGKATGPITFYQDSGAINVAGAIAAGDKRTEQAAATVQNGRLAMITSLRVSTSAVAGYVSLVAEGWTGATLIKSYQLTEQIRVGTAGPTTIKFDNPPVVDLSRGNANGNYSWRVMAYWQADSATSTKAIVAFDYIEGNYK